MPPDFPPAVVGRLDVTGAGGDGGGKPWCFSLSSQVGNSNVVPASGTLQNPGRRHLRRVAQVSRSVQKRQKNGRRRAVAEPPYTRIPKGRVRGQKNRVALSR